MILFPFVLLCTFPLAAQSVDPVPQANLVGKHRGAVTALLRDEQGRILSAGEDGFIEIWNSQAAEERFQLSPYGITSMVLRPGKSQVCVVESDGLSLYRISAWDYEKKENLFTLRFRDSVSYINYSAAGSFLIVVRSGNTGVVFINAETGEQLESPVEFPGTVTFAATSRSEKVMISYLSSGVLSYWDLETGNELQHFTVPPNITSPSLFGNYCFFGGFDSQGLLILDAVSGQTIARDQYSRQGSIFVDDKSSLDSRGSAQFNYYTLAGGTGLIARMEINRYGLLTTVSRRTIPASIANITSIISGDSGTAVIGTAQGVLWSFGTSARLLGTGNPDRIIDIATASDAIVFITESGVLGYIPADYSLLSQNSIVTLEDATDTYGSGIYTNIVSDSQSNSRFLLWHPGAGSSVPMIKTLTGFSTGISASATDGTTAGSGDSSEAGDSGAIVTSGFYLDKLVQRYPVRQAALLGKNLLFLDSAGNATILDTDTGDIRSTYTAAGAVDAAFIDQNTIILGRSAIAGSSPFLTVNISTGETVPLTYPAVVGVRVYRGSSGTIYGAVVNQSSGTTQTTIVKLDLANPAQSERLVEYDGEDSSFELAESGGNLATTLGGDGATLYRTARTQPVNNGAGQSKTGVQNSGPEIIPFERSMGLPVKIITGKNRFIVLDGEGGIAWHDNTTGKLLAVYRLYLNTGANSSARLVSGTTSTGASQLYPNLWILEKTQLSGQNKDADQSNGTNQDKETISGAFKRK